MLRLSKGIVWDNSPSSIPEMTRSSNWRFFISIQRVEGHIERIRTTLRNCDIATNVDVASRLAVSTSDSSSNFQS